MKRIALVLLIFVLAAPAWAGKSMTVGQLEEMLRSMQRDKKADADIATALKQVELTEQLTRAAMNGLIQFVPGPYSTEQIYVLEARTADLVPPPSDLPSTPAPDEATQKTLLSRAESYVTNTYDRLPRVSAVRTTLRFQDNMDVVAASSGVVGSAEDAVTSTRFNNASAYIHYINSSATPVTFEHGVEKPAAQKDKIKWGANRMITLQSPPPDLGAVFREATQAGTLQWLRWETLNGKPAAVFSFTVSKKEPHLNVKVCCFPSINQTGIARFYTSTTARSLGGEDASSGGGGVSGNYQTNTEWHDFTTTVPYHGEIFIDPVTGIVVRIITQADFKPGEVVHQFDTRIDYGPVKLGTSTVMAPVKSFVTTVVVPGGESGTGIYATRCTLFTSEYKGYTQEGAAR